MYLVFDIGGTAIKYCWMNEAGEIFNKQEISSTAVDSWILGNVHSVFLLKETYWC